MTQKEKVLGTLTLAAIGDAMGSATENLSFNEIRRKFNGGVKEFLKPGETAFALGNEIGQVTDDFSQIYIICKEIIKNNGEIDEDVVIKSILEWADIPKFFNRFAGPTTRGAVEKYKDPNHKMKPLEGAVTVDYASKATNGAAMKIAPAGMFNQMDFNGAIRDAITITNVTHDNSLAISGACAVATAIAESYRDDSTFEDLISAGLYGAERGEEEGNKIREVAGPSVVERIKLAVTIAEENGTKDEKLRKLYQIVGSGLHISEAVPCAFGIIRLNIDDPLQAVIDAVNIGYDTDTIATIVGSIVGAKSIQTKQISDMLDIIERANNFKIRELALEISQLN